MNTSWQYSLPGRTEIFSPHSTQLLQSPPGLLTGTAHEEASRLSQNAVRWLRNSAVPVGWKQQKKKLNYRSKVFIFIGNTVTWLQCTDEHHKSSCMCTKHTEDVSQVTTNRQKTQHTVCKQVKPFLIPCGSWLLGLTATVHSHENDADAAFEYNKWTIFTQRDSCRWLQVSADTKSK